MNLFWNLIFLGIGLLVCAVVVWFVRRSALSAQKEDYEARELALLAQVRADFGQKPVQDLKEFEDPSPVRQERVDTRSKKQRPSPVIDAKAQKIFAALKRILGPYPLLVNVDVASLLEQEDVIPPRVCADFVVCRKDFTPVAVILLERQQPDPLHERAMSLINRNRIRVLRWDAAAPLDQETMRRQIFKPKKPAEAS